MITLLSSFTPAFDLPPLEWKAWVAAVLLVLTVIALILEIRPPDITLLISGGLLVVTGVLPPNKFLEGFANDIVITIAMLCVLVRGLEVHGITESIARRILIPTNSVHKQLSILTLASAFISAFVNNTPLVLLMTPLVRQWAIDNKQSASMLLLPLSYATILGGMCTIIGTSTNVIVAGLLQEHEQSSPLGFFELAWIGIPCLILGLLYIVYLIPRWLPVRQDPTALLQDKSREFMGEFVVQTDCSLVGKKVVEAEGNYFKEGLLIQVERHGAVIHAPSSEFIIRAEDRLVFVGDMHKIASLYRIKGLQSQADPQFKLDISSPHFSEVVVSLNSSLVGRSLKGVRFRERYGASAFAIYREGQYLHTSKLNDIPLRAGDTLMLFSNEPWLGAEYFTRDFYTIRLNERLQVFHPWRGSITLAALGGMIIAAVAGIPMMTASIAAVLVLIFTRAITIREAQRGIRWNLLLMLAASFAIGRTLEITGLASYFAAFILSIVGTHPYAVIGGIMLVTMVSSELLSNNMTALIIFPIAITMVQFAGYTSVLALKAVAIAVALGSSCCFAMPLGYQTHMIVYGPGGYKYTDFMRVGIPLDLLILLIGTFLIPILWPFA